jgi:uncharacterized protein (TIGR02996 family)
MNTEAALLRTIRDAPDDDTARLVYADFVEEEGDPARGEFIRVQIALANTPADDPTRKTLEERERELLDEHQSRWLGVPTNTDGLSEWRFARGFVDDITATPSFMLNEGSDLCAAHPVRCWRVSSSQGDLPEDLLEAGRRGWFSRLESLHLSGWYSSIGELERFLLRSDFERLRELDLTGRPGLDVLPEILERAPFREQLKVLRVGGPSQWDTPLLNAADLALALGPSQLTELTVIGGRLTAQDVRDLFVGEWANSLTTLGLSRNSLTDEAVQILAARTQLKQLRVLDLSFNVGYAGFADYPDEVETDPEQAFTDAGLRTLLESPNMANLVELNVAGLTFNEATRAALVARFGSRLRT